MVRISVLIVCAFLSSTFGHSAQAQAPTATPTVAPTSGASTTPKATPTPTPAGQAAPIHAKSVNIDELAGRRSVALAFDQWLQLYGSLRKDELLAAPVIARRCEKDAGCYVGNDVSPTTQCEAHFTGACLLGVDRYTIGEGKEGFTVHIPPLEHSQQYSIQLKRETLKPVVLTVDQRQMLALAISDAMEQPGIAFPAEPTVKGVCLAASKSVERALGSNYKVNPASPLGSCAAAEGESMQPPSIKDAIGPLLSAEVAIKQDFPENTEGDRQAVSKFLKTYLPAVIGSSTWRRERSGFRTLLVEGDGAADARQLLQSESLQTTYASLFKDDADIYVDSSSKALSLSADFASLSAAVSTLKNTLAKKDAANTRVIFENALRGGEGSVDVYLTRIAAAADQIQDELQGLDADFTKRDEKAGELEKEAASLARESVTQIIGGSTIGDVSTLSSWYISADVGLAYMWDLEEVTPYLGTNIYLRPINKDVPLSALEAMGILSPLHRFSFLIAVTTESVSKQGERAGLIGDKGLIVGAGWRMTDITRLNAGVVVLNEQDPNPLINDESIAVTPFVSVSFDVNVAAGMSQIFGTSLGK